MKNKLLILLVGLAALLSIAAVTVTESEALVVAIANQERQAQLNPPAP